MQSAAPQGQQQGLWRAKHAGDDARPIARRDADERLAQPCLRGEYDINDRPSACACNRRRLYSRLMNPRSPARCACAIRLPSLATVVHHRALDRRELGQELHHAIERG